MSNMEIKPLIYVSSANIKTNVVYPSIDFVKLGKVNKFLIEVVYYKKCENKKGDKCMHPHCQYACYVLDRNGGYARCGRK